jgi:hypothetical protein
MPVTRTGPRTRGKMCVDPDLAFKTYFRDEAGEEIWDNVIDVSNHLIGFVSGPTIRRSHRTKTFNRELIKRMEARLLELVAAPPKSARKTIAAIPAG